MLKVLPGGGASTGPPDQFDGSPLSVAPPALTNCLVVKVGRKSRDDADLGLDASSKDGWIKATGLDITYSQLARIRGWASLSKRTGSPCFRRVVLLSFSGFKSFGGGDRSGRKARKISSSDTNGPWWPPARAWLLTLWPSICGIRVRGSVKPA